MLDSLYIRETSDLTTIEISLYGYPAETVVLRSGNLARLAAPGDSAPVLQIFEPGNPVPLAETPLPAPAGTEAFWRAEIITAPNGRAAIVYDSATPRDPDTRDSDVIVRAVSLSDDGELVGEPVVLHRTPSEGWLQTSLFDGGGYASAFITDVYDEDGSSYDYEYGSFTRQTTITRTTADGTPFPESIAVFDDPEIIFDDVQALPGDRLLLIWGDFSAAGEKRFQIYEADGSVLSPPQSVVGEWYPADFEVLALSDDSLMAVWAGGDAESRSINTSLLNADGSLGEITTHESLVRGSDNFLSIVNVASLTEGGIGMIYELFEPGDYSTYYQRFAADGSTMGDPAEVPTDMLDTFIYDTKVLPLGGFAVLSSQYTSDGFYEELLQFFSSDGEPLGPPEFVAGYGDAIHFNEFLVQPDGTLFLQSERTNSVTDGVQISWIGYGPIEFRPLTEGEDVEILTMPEAVDGLGGDDEIIGSDDADRILGGEGDDLIEGEDGDDLLSGGSGSNLIDGGPGVDTAFFGDAFAAFDFVFEDRTEDVIVEGPDSSDRLLGVERFAFGDMTIEAEDLLLLGGYYDDSLEGTVGPDSLSGDIGDDVLQGLDGDDFLDGGTGRDRINGGDGDDVIIGGPADTDLGDRIFGGDGDDSVNGGAGNDLIYGQDGNDTLAGGFGVDEIFGQNGDDVITGSAFSDLVFGGDGDDFVNGGFGFDRVNGGAGADMFYHAGVRGHGTDWIQDYSADDGDMFLFGGAGASLDEFRLTFAHARSGAGDDDVEEAYIAHVPTGRVIWALVDGAAEDEIWMKLADTGAVHDLMDIA